MPKDVIFNEASQEGSSLTTLACLVRSDTNLCLTSSFENNLAASYSHGLPESYGSLLRFS